MPLTHLASSARAGMRALPALRPSLALAVGLGLGLGLGLAHGARATASAAPARPDPAQLSHRIAGGRSQHCVAPGETLLSIAARYGEPLSRLLSDNRLDARALLHPGRCLRIDNPHIVPAPAPPDGVLIDIPQRMLFRWHHGELAAAYPVAVGRPDWPTPVGDFRVAQLRRDPTWYVPPSIQEEQRRKGEPVRREVPSGPDNPLGHSWIGLDLRGYGIHGTNAPASIYSFRTHGCIRLQDDHATELFLAVQPGTPVRIVYRTWLLAELPGGSLWLESDPDIYARSVRGDDLRQLQRLAELHGLQARIDWNLARQVLSRKAGIAEPVDLAHAAMRQRGPCCAASASAHPAS